MWGDSSPPGRLGRRPELHTVPLRPGDLRYPADRLSVFSAVACSFLKLTFENLLISFRRTQDSAQTFPPTFVLLFKLRLNLGEQGLHGFLLAHVVASLLPLLCTDGAEDDAPIWFPFHPLLKRCTVLEYAGISLVDEEQMRHPNRPAGGSFSE